MARASCFDLALFLCIAAAVGPHCASAGSSRSGSRSPLYCDPPRVPEHGDYDGERRQYYTLGTVVNYRCDHGYQLDGNPWTVCAYNDHGPYWIYDAPVCRRE